MHFVNYRVYNKDITDREILDFSCQGNVIRFYLGKNGEQWGDDWSDPFDNAGSVYNQYVGATVDLYVPYEYTVLNPYDTSYYYYNSYSKEQMLHKCFPCVVILPEETQQYYYDLTFDKCQGCYDAVKFYCGDDLSKECETAGTADDVFFDEIKSACGKTEIIDMTFNGNLVHFYLGENGKQSGTDWDMADYTVYAEPVDMYVPFGWKVLEPSDSNYYYHQCPYCKNDMVNRKIPCVLVVPFDIVDEDYKSGIDYEHALKTPGVRKLYFGDDILNTKLKD